MARRLPHRDAAFSTVNGAFDFIDFVKRAFGAVEVSRAPGRSGKLNDMGR